MNSQVNTKTLGALVEEHVRQWEQTPIEKRHHWRVPNIAISREAGTTAEEVAQLLAGTHKMHLYDDELLQRIAQEAQVSEVMVRSLDERGVNFLENMIEKFLDPNGFSSDRYLEDLLRILGMVDWCGNGIIIGRGAAFALRSEANLRVRFVAPMEYRLQRTLRAHPGSESDARQTLQKLDEARTVFVQKAFNVDPADPRQYDLVINSPHLSIDEAADLITRGLEIKRVRANKQAERLQNLEVALPEAGVS